MPLRGPALLLTGIVRTSQDGSRRRRGFPPAIRWSWPAPRPASSASKLGAQAAAAMDVLARAREASERDPGVGYLVRVREASFLVPHLPVDTTLRVTARLEGAALPLAVHRITVGTGDTDFVRARIATHRGSP